MGDGCPECHPTDTECPRCGRDVVAALAEYDARKLADKSTLIDAMTETAAEYFNIDPTLIDTDPETPRIRGLMDALLKRLEELGAV